MTSKEITLWVVLVVFTAFSLSVTWDEGAAGFFALLSGGWSLQVTADLVVALTLFIVWMLGDAQQRGTSGWPFVILILFTGSIGAMIYLITRERSISAAA